MIKTRSLEEGPHGAGTQTSEEDGKEAEEVLGAGSLEQAGSH